MRKVSKQKQSEEEAIASHEFQELLNSWRGFARVPTEKILKNLKFKVSLERLFNPDEYKELSKLERKRIKNINDRLSLMFVAGMPLPSENALRIKVGLPPHRKFVCGKDSDDNNDDDDETWKPSKPRATHHHLLSMTEYLTHQKFFLMKLMVSVDGGKTDAKKCKEEMGAIMSSWTRDLLQSINTDEKKPLKVKNVKTLTNKEVQYTTRGIKKDYAEPQIPDDDHYMHCDVCNKLYEGNCPKHGPYMEVHNAPVKWGLVDRARRTCPDGISVAQSKIRSGGLGVWADKDFPRNSVFGPYEGVDVHRLDVQKLRLLFEGGCAWEVYKKGSLSHYIDGSDVKKSNWLRYINCARNEEEQNLISYQLKGKIYYHAYKDIEKGTELLVWYGSQYAEQLGIAEQKVDTATKTLPFFAPENVYECRKCGSLFANEEALKRHTKVKHSNRSVMKRYKCEFCSYSSDNKHNVEQHTRTHTKEKPFACSMCSKKFAQKGSLDCHFRTHTGECPHECNVCGKKFNRSSDLKRHIRVVHDKCKSFVCKVCGCTFGRSDDLKSHMTTHTGVRNYKCQYCDKRFAQSGNLRTHERIHTGEKPHKCEECFVAFTNSSSLRYHVITHHTKRYPHRCSVCKKGFLFPTELKNHKMRCKN